MEYVHAALLLHRLGKEVNEGTIKKIVEAAGVKPDEIRIKALVTALGEVNIEEALKSAAAASFAPPPAAPAAPAAARKRRKWKKRRRKKRPSQGSPHSSVRSLRTSSALSLSVS